MEIIDFIGGVFLVVMMILIIAYGITISLPAIEQGVKYIARLLGV